VTAAGWLSCGIVSSTEVPSVVPSGPGCFLCGRAAFDPDKRERPWIRAVAGGAQVLICPACQDVRPDWTRMVDRCKACDGTRLSAVLGRVVCRACGHVQRVEEEEETAGPGA